MARIEVSKQIYAALNEDRAADALDFFDPSIVRVEFEGTPSGGTYREHSGVRAHFVNGRSTWAEGLCKPVGFISIDDRIVVLVHVRVRLKDQVDWLEGRLADVFTFSGSKIVEMRTFAETHDALLWAGVAIQ